MMTLASTPGIVYVEGGGPNIELIGLAAGIVISLAVGAWKALRGR